MKKAITITLFLIVAGLAGFTQQLVLIHTNDMHSNLTGFGPEIDYTPMELNNDSTFGGFARLATLIKQEKEAHQNSLLVCDAGDFLMGTIFQAEESKAGFQLRLMKQIGYDVLTIGNHEFDFGPKMLAQIINAGYSHGKIPQLVATQFQFSAESTEDDNLQKLVIDKKIKPFEVFTRNGLKIGVFGILGESAVHDAPAATPLTFANRFKTAASITKILREQEKVDVVVCLSHSGVYYDENGNLIGEDIQLAKKVPDIDVIISGHSHVATVQPEKIGKTLVVQTGSYINNLGRLELNYENGILASYNFELIPVNDAVVGDSTVNQKIEAFKKEVSAEYFSPLGVEYNTPIAEIDYMMRRGNDEKKEVGCVGTFLADAINYYTDIYGTPSSVVIVAHGIVRESFMKGEISAADAFRVAPLGSGKSDLPGYSLAQIYITGREIKKLMELILMSSHPGSNNYLYFSGVEADYNPKKIILRKVQKVRVDGREINISKDDTTLYSLTANTYLLSFIGEIKQMSKGLIKIIPKDVNGNPVTNVKQNLLDLDKNVPGLQEGKEWIALIEYLKQFNDINANGIPDVPQDYIAPPIRLHKTNLKK